MRRFVHFLESERAIYALVAIFIALGALYSITTPLFEAGDELWHYPYVQWVALGNGLPIQDPAQRQLWSQEGGQPPLYYVTSAALTFWVNTSDMQDRLWRNPYAKIGVPLAYGNKNMIVHTSAENFPWQGTTLAVHLIRLLSVLFSAGTVYLTYRIARELVIFSVTRHRSLLTPPSSVLPLLASALVAFNPMFLFISASVNNDSLTALLATAGLLLTVQLVILGATNRRLLTLGIVCGLAVMTKVSDLAVIVVALCVVSWLAFRARDSKLLLRGGVLILVPVLLIGGWWFVRNYFLYYDPLAFNVWLQIGGGRPPTNLFGLLGEFEGFRISFWGNFGGVNVIAPTWVYRTLDLITILAIIGLALALFKRELPPLLLIPTLLLAGVFVALVRWTLLTYASQGRLIFPAIASVAILMAYGLYFVSIYFVGFVRRILQIPFSFAYALPIGAVLFLLGFALLAPFVLIAPVYAQPERLADESSIPSYVRIKYDAGDARPELIGFRLPKRVEPGDDVPVTLYWRTDKRIGEDLAVYIHIYDADGNLIGQWDSLPGNGILPTRLWRPNEILMDEYQVPVTLPSTYPPTGRVEVGLTRVGTSLTLDAYNPSGEKVSPTIHTFKFKLPTDPPQPFVLKLGDQFAVVTLNLGVERAGRFFTFDQDNLQSVSLKPGNVLNLDVALQAMRVPDADYTFFLHLVDAKGHIVAQHDTAPLDGAYPTTLWDTNEKVENVIQLQLPDNLPKGKYLLEFGMYRASDLERLLTFGDDWSIWHVASDHVTSMPIQVEEK